MRDIHQPVSVMRWDRAILNGSLGERDDSMGDMGDMKIRDGLQMLQWRFDPTTARLNKCEFPGGCFLFKVHYTDFKRSK